MIRKTDLYYKDNSDELTKLFANKEKPFVLFLGAGVNGYYKNLGWNALLTSLLEKTISLITVSENGNKEQKKDVLDFLDNECESGFNSYMKASIIKKVLGNQYISFLQDHLYANCNKKMIEKSLDPEKNILIAIAKLILNNDNIKAVVTYNYDNFLSTAIKLLAESKGDNFREIAPIDIYRSIQMLSPDKHSFPIYHVHGFIPPPDQAQISQAENVVLAYDEYFNNIMEPYSWQTTTQLHFLNNYNVLFIGASLDDWNMLKALSFSKKYSVAVRHFAIFNNKFYKEGTNRAMFINRLKSSALEEVGIHSIFTKTSDYSEIVKLINQLK